MVVMERHLGRGSSAGPPGFAGRGDRSAQPPRPPQPAGLLLRHWAWGAVACLGAATRQLLAWPGAAREFVGETYVVTASTTVTVNTEGRWMCHRRA